MSKNVVKNIYMGNNNNIIDINYNIEIYGQKTKCEIKSQGTINDYCKKNFSFCYLFQIVKVLLVVITYIFYNKISFCIFHICYVYIFN